MPSPHIIIPSSAFRHVEQELSIDVVDNVNTIFTTQYPFLRSSFNVYFNGVMESRAHYIFLDLLGNPTEVSQSIQFLTAPWSPGCDVTYSYYRYK